MEKWLDKYRERFGEQFPMMLCRHMDESEIIETVKGCIEKGKAYEPRLKKDAYY